MKNGILKTIATIAFIAIITSFVTSSQIEKPNVLQGMWELIQQNKPTGMMKVFNADGTMANVAHVANGFVLTMEGLYKIKSGSFYTEKIEKSSYTPLNGKDNEIKYILNDNQLNITFSVSGKEYKETYKKVGFIKGF